LDLGRTCNFNLAQQSKNKQTNCMSVAERSACKLCIRIQCSKQKKKKISKTEDNQETPGAEEDIKAMEMTWNQLEQKALDRDAWRSPVGGLIAPGKVVSKSKKAKQSAQFIRSNKPYIHAA
jgi:hypothetical protein